ncbi:MAG: hypothetical protein A2Z03_10675 [Chloroflexi bacterium RBG_16_56_8]|nr:MAG: hypothetical protein A2Z03_10675 [Chloroflexi bacterium RBG_16_56_8]
MSTIRNSLARSRTAEWWAAVFWANLDILTLTTRGLTRGRRGRSIRQSAISVSKYGRFCSRCVGKGLGERAVIYKHAFKNAAIPLVTMTGLQELTLMRIHL